LPPCIRQPGSAGSSHSSAKYAQKSAAAPIAPASAATGTARPTDANAAYRVFTRAHGIAHQAVNLSAGERIRNGAEGVIHVQNVNAYHRRFKEWLARFHGVASRWLPNYLGWHWALDGGRVTSVEQLLRIAFGLINR